MFNSLMRIIVAFSFSLSFSKFVSGFMFDSGTASFIIASTGLGLVLTGRFYRGLHNLFAVKLIVVEKEAYDKMVEEELKGAKDEQER